MGKTGKYGSIAVTGSDGGAAAAASASAVGGGKYADAYWVRVPD